MAEISYMIHISEGRNDESPQVLYAYKDESITIKEVYNVFKGIYPDKGISIEAGFAGYPDEVGWVYK